MSEFWSPEVDWRLRRENSPHKKAFQRAKAEWSPEPKPLREPQQLEGADLAWYVARSEAGAALEVVDDLRRGGIGGYAPAGRRIVLRARLRGGKRGPAVREFAVFGDYLFVGIGPGGVASRRLHGCIIDVLGGEDGPQRVPFATLLTINRLDLAGEWGCRLTLENSRGGGWKVGQKVTIADGPFEGFRGLISALPSEMRARVELAIFGSVHNVQIDACALLAI